MRHTRTILVPLGLMVYVLLFMTTELPSLQRDTGRAPSRIELVFQLLLLLGQL